MVTVSDNPKWHEDILKVINAFKDSFAFYNCDVIDFLNAMKTMLNYSNQDPVIVFDQKIAPKGPKKGKRGPKCGQIYNKKLRLFFQNQSWLST